MYCINPVDRADILRVFWGFDQTWSLANTVVWNDLEFFFFFESGNIAADQVYFNEANSRKSATFVTRARGSCAAKFSFFKNHRVLKNEYFLKICKYLHFPSKNIWQKKIGIQFGFCLTH